MIIPELTRQRLLANVTTTPGGCMLSKYSIGSHGYAQVGWRFDGRRIMTLAHRVAWIIARGAIPTGMTVDHMCKQKRCINVNHLRLLSNYENGRRTAGRDWPIGQCARGHDAAELTTQPSGRRRCRSCQREETARYAAKVAAA